MAGQPDELAFGALELRACGEHHRQRPIHVIGVEIAEEFADLSDARDYPA